ncbi:unnamed protein product [Trichobilharzia regenti]|nr:unnamed protein product [Trichobilharzia regenti]
MLKRKSLKRYSVMLQMVFPLKIVHYLKWKVSSPYLNVVLAFIMEVYCPY